MLKKVFSVILLVSTIFFSDQIICIPEVEARSIKDYDVQVDNYYPLVNGYYILVGTGGDDYFAFSDNGIEYYIYYVNCVSSNPYILNVDLKGVKNGKKVDYLHYRFNIANTATYDLSSSGHLGNERGYVASDSRANTVFHITQSTDFMKAMILSNPNIVYKIAHNLLEKGLKTNKEIYYVQAIPYYELYIEQRIKLKEDFLDFVDYFVKHRFIQEADVNIGIGYSEIGICYAGIGDYNKAEECYYKIKPISPPKDNFEGTWRYYYGVLCEKLKLYDEALYNYNVALKKGWSRDLLSDVKESKHRLENLGIKPSSKSQYTLSKDRSINEIIKKANGYIKDKYYVLAQDILEKALQKEPNAELYFQLAKVHMKYKKKDYKLMIDLVSKAIKLDPKNPEYYDYMANIYWRVNDKRYYEFKYKANELRSLGSN